MSKQQPKSTRSERTPKMCSSHLLKVKSQVNARIGKKKIKTHYSQLVLTQKSDNTPKFKKKFQTSYKSSLKKDANLKDMAYGKVQRIAYSCEF